MATASTQLIVEMLKTSKNKDKACIDGFMYTLSRSTSTGSHCEKRGTCNYIGRRLPDQSRRTPPYPIRIWNMFVRVISRTARTNNAVEGWHNAFKSGINCPHPSFIKLLSHLQREQSLQEANVVKWEAGETSSISKSSETRNERIFNIVSNYENRETLSYLRGIAFNFQF